MSLVREEHVDALRELVTARDVAATRRIPDVSVMDAGDRAARVL